MDFFQPDLYHTHKFLLPKQHTFFVCQNLSLFAIKIVATALSVKFVSALASFTNLSTSNNNASRLTGITFTAESVDASIIKPMSVRPAATF